MTVAVEFAGLGPAKVVGVAVHDEHGRRAVYPTSDLTSLVDPETGRDLERTSCGYAVMAFLRAAQALFQARWDEECWWEREWRRSHPDRNVPPIYWRKDKLYLRWGQRLVRDDWTGRLEWRGPADRDVTSCAGYQRARDAAADLRRHLGSDTQYQLVLSMIR